VTGPCSGLGLSGTTARTTPPTSLFIPAREDRENRKHNLSELKFPPPSHWKNASHSYRRQGPRRQHISLGAGGGATAWAGRAKAGGRGRRAESEPNKSTHKGKSRWYAVRACHADAPHVSLPDFGHQWKPPRKRLITPSKSSRRVIHAGRKAEHNSLSKWWNLRAVNC